MASLFSTIAKFANSPQGRQAIARAKAAADKPENRAKIEQLARKLQGRGGAGGGRGGYGGRPR